MIFRPYCQCARYLHSLCIAYEVEKPLPEDVEVFAVVRQRCWRCGESHKISKTGKTFTMSSGKKNETLRGQEKECEAGQSGSSAQRLRLTVKRSQEDEDPTVRRKTEESTGALKRCLSESFVKPNSSKNSPLDLTNAVQDACGVKPLLTEASKSYRNSLMINQKLPARSLVGPSGSQTRLVSGKSRRDSPWPSHENLTFLKKNRSASMLSDGVSADGAGSAEDPEDVDQLKGKLRKSTAGKSLVDSNEVMLADRLALWDPWAGVGVAVDQAEQRPVVVVHSEPMVTTFSILKNGRPVSEQGAGAAPPQEKRVKWRETVDVILYSGDSVVGRHTEQLREEWGAGRTLGGVVKRGSIDRCPYVDPGPLH